MSDRIMHAKLIGIYEMVFGLMGGIACLFRLLAASQQLTDNSVFVMNVAFAICLYLACAYAGFRLYQRKIAGYELSLLIQALQVPKLILAGFSYFFVAGPYLVFGAGQETGIGLSFNISLMQFEFGVTYNEPIYDIGVNSIALIVCVFLYRLYKQRKFELQMLQLNECPFCGAAMNLSSISGLAVFCQNCQNVIRAKDLAKKRRA